MTPSDRQPRPHDSLPANAVDHTQQAINPSLQIERRLLTERAVFRPRQGVEVSDSGLPQAAASIDRLSDQSMGHPLQSGEYRVPILYLGQDELIAVLPEHENRIRQLTDLEIEALALEIESSLTELYGMVMRIAWAAFLDSKPFLR